MKLWPVWSMVGSSAAEVFGVPVYRTEWTEWVHRRIAMPFDRAWWALLHRFHPAHRYNIARTNLPPGYYDPDTVILHACMEQLCSWIESRGGEEAVQKWTDDLRSDPGENDSPVRANRQADHQQTALDIYRWWKRERPADVKREDDLLMAGFSGETWTTKPTDNPHLVEMVFPEVAPDKQTIRDQHTAIEDKIASDEQAMLHRLIDIRQGLW